MTFDPAVLFGPVADGSIVEIAVRPSDYSASVIARAIEDVDAHLINLNVMSRRTEHDELLVHLRIDRRAAHAAARSLERYGLRVVSVSEGQSDDADDDGGRGDSDDTTRERINELLRMLEV